MIYLAAYIVGFAFFFVLSAWLFSDAEAIDRSDALLFCFVWPVVLVMALGLAPIVLTYYFYERLTEYFRKKKEGNK